MPWSEAVYLWLIDSAVVSLLVLAVGSGAILLCPRPARRAWIIELILVGCLVAPWLGTIPGYPRLGFGWAAATSLHQEEAVLPSSTGTAEGRPTVISQSDDLPVSPQTVFVEAAPRTTDAPSHPFDLASWIVTVYAIGVSLGLGWWLVGLLGLVKFMRTTRPAPSRCQELLAQIAGQRADRVKLLVSRRVRQPFAFAFGRPVIVLPEDLCSDDRVLRWSLAHEWAHIERHHFRAWLLAGLTRVLFFYHPLVWWMRYQLRLCQDFLADDRAARQTPQPEDYAEFLTARAAGGALRPALVGLGMGASKSELYRRVVMLVQNRPLESRVPWLWTLAVTCAAFVLVATMGAFTISRQAAAQGEPSAAEEKPAPVASPPSPPLSPASLPAEPIKRSQTQPELAGIVYSVKFSPDGKLLASGWGDGTIKLWDVASRKHFAIFVAPKAGGNLNETILIRSVAFSPDGKTLASGDNGNTSGGVIRLWDVASGKNTATFNGYYGEPWQVGVSGIYCVVFSPDGKTLASGHEDNLIRLWDVASGKITATFEADSDDRAYAVAFSPDGKTLASGGHNGTIKLWDVTSGKNTATFKAVGSGNSVYSLAFSPDGRTLAAGCWLEGGGMLWDVASGKNTAKFKFDRADSAGLKNHNNMISSVAFSPDGKTLGLGSYNGLIGLWDVNSAQKIAVLKGHTALVRSLAFSPNGDILASGSDDSDVKLWEVGKNANRTGSARVEAKTEENVGRTAPASPVSPVTVRGKVIDENGKPVDGADVWLPLFLRGVADIHTLHVSSDAQGRFALEVTPDWLGKMQPWDRAMTIWAYTAGHQLGTGRATFSSRAPDTVIRLGPATDTSFVVLDPAGQPLAGALVEPFYISTSLALQFPPDELLARVSARTDAEGRAKLPAAPPDLLYQVRVTTKSFGIQMQPTIVVPAIFPKTVRLRPVGRIEGRLVADRPAFVRGLRLAFTSQDNSGITPRPWPTGPTEGFARAKSDEQGRFVVPTIAVGDVQIEALVNETQPLRPRLPASLRVQAGQTTSLEIPMLPTVVVRGSVRVKDTGRPLPGALIRIYYGVFRQGAESVSDAQGKVTARVLPGDIRVQVISMPRGYAWVHGDPFPSYQVPEDAKEFDLPTVEVQPTKSIPGRVVDQQGQPVENAWISVVDGDRHYGRGKSDKNGQFEVAGVPVTIDPANVKYVWFPEVGPGRPFVSTMPSQCEVLKTDPLTVRALPRDPRIDLP